MSQSALNERWRVFIAIELPLEVRDRLVAHATHLREIVPQAQASWSRPENIHLTLKFLGETPIAKIDSLSEATTRSVERFYPFKIEVGGTGAFPTRAAPKVLWIGLSDPEGKLGKLHAGLEEECYRSEFGKEARPFHPHLTIARLRQPKHAHELAAAHKQMRFEPAEFPVSEVLVIRSELSSAGSRYTIISRHRLRTH